MKHRNILPEKDQALQSICCENSQARNRFIGIVV